MDNGIAKELLEELEKINNVLPEFVEKVNVPCEVSQWLEKHFLPDLRRRYTIEVNSLFVELMSRMTDVVELYKSAEVCVPEIVKEMHSSPSD